MSDKILSQDEISALLGGGGDKKKKRKKKPGADVSKGASSPESSTAAGASAEKIAESVATFGSLNTIEDSTRLVVMETTRSKIVYR